MKLPPLLLSIALVACGSPSAASDRYGKQIADEFMADCMRANAANARAAGILKEVCSCTSGKIHSSVRAGDSGEIVNAKIETARRACLRKAYPNGI
jgi:hypothetical protein